MIRSAAKSAKGTRYPTALFQAYDKIEPLERRSMLAVDLVADINLAPSNEFKPAGLVALNEVVYYAHSDGLSGVELWRSDGTEQGTWRVKDIAAGAVNSSPKDLKAVGGLVFFSADDGVHGSELWRTDGTTAGTYMIKDIRAGAGGSAPAGFHAFNGKVYFSALDDTNGRELWSTDGTAAQTQLVADIYPGAVSSAPLNITSLGEAIYFSAIMPNVGRELVKSAGTASSTQLVADVLPGENSSSPVNFAVANGSLFFSAQESIFGNLRSFWRSDGTGIGTVKLVSQGFNPQPISRIVASGGLAYFAANSATGHRLWKSDGTPAGTQVVTAVTGTIQDSNVPNLVDAAGSLFVSTISNVNSRILLWKVSAGGNAAVQLANFGSETELDRFTAVGSQLYFTLADSSFGAELYRSDGTPAGTGRVLDIAPGSASSSPSELVALSSSVLVFVAADPNLGAELWRTAGTAATTAAVADTFRGTDWASPFPLGRIGNKLILAATDSNGDREVWSTDGTTAGTTLLKNINPNGSSGPSIVFGDGGPYVFFTAYTPATGFELWRTDGTTVGTVFLGDLNPGTEATSVNHCIFLGGSYFFSAYDSQTSESVLWRTDGTPLGTTKISLGASGPRAISSPVLFNGMLYFTGVTSSTGRELFKSNGTAAGTSLVKDIQPGSIGSDIFELVAKGNRLYISAATVAHGREPWISDGTNAGTVLLADLEPGSGNSMPFDFTSVGSKVYFTATTTAVGRELFVSDGSSVGTGLAADVYPGPNSSNAEPMEVVGDRLLFNADTPALGIELWSIGPQQAAAPVRDINPGTSPSMLFVVPTTYRNVMFFMADDGVHGSELWASDGTTAGTMLIADINAGPRVGEPSAFAALGSDLYFRAVGSLAGNELHVLRDTAGPHLDAASFDVDAGPSLVFEFDEAIRGGLSPSQISLVNQDTGATVNNAVLSVSQTRAIPPRFRAALSTALADGNYRASIPGQLQDVFGQSSSNLPSLNFFVFAGDANRDRIVNIADFSILASRFNLSGTFSQGDFNYDGITNISDFAILASKFNTSLAAPSALPRAFSALKVESPMREYAKVSDEIDLASQFE